MPWEFLEDQAKNHRWDGSLLEKSWIVHICNIYREEMLKKMLAEVVLEAYNASWGNQICSYRKAIHFVGVEHLGNNKPELHGRPGTGLIIHF